MKKVAVIGGGTGTYVVLSGLKKYDLDLSAVVSMMDSGGSTGRLRDQLGVLPPGDLRQSLLALSEASELWRRLFLYRFENGDLKGHNFGNIFLSALEKVCPDYDTVLETANYVLKTKGKVIPVTFHKTHLCVKYENGTVLKGESTIDEENQERSRIVKTYLDPAVGSNQDAINALKNSDYIVVGPGDLHTSIIPVLLVDGIKETIATSQAKIIYILNLMTKNGQTTNYAASDFLNDITHYLGRTPDFIVAHKGSIPKSIIDWYENYDEHPVKNDLTHENFKGTMIEEDVINRNHIEKSAGDALTRSILRHDTDKLTEILMKII